MHTHANTLPAERNQHGKLRFGRGQRGHGLQGNEFTELENPRPPILTNKIIPSGTSRLRDLTLGYPRIYSKSVDNSDPHPGWQ